MNNLDDRSSWVFYKDREEWTDMQPVKQLEGPQPVVRIAYSPEFEDVYDYFRGVVAAGELSERALQLTEDCIQFNAANYTVWQYRRLILKHLGGNLRDELEFCREMIEENPKNYQVWHHRRVIVEWLGDGSKELRLTQIIFSQDAKNYHAWEHRQWALRTFKLYDEELNFTEDLLLNDIRNNSAWNHRYFVISRTSGITLDVLKRELLFVKESLCKLQNNESPWSYMKGLLQDTVADDEEVQACWLEVENWCWEIVHRECQEEPISVLPKGKISPHLLIGLLDAISYKLQKLTDPKATEAALQKAHMLCVALAEKQDTIRCKYWLYIDAQLSAQYSNKS